VHEKVRPVSAVELAYWFVTQKKGELWEQRWVHSLVLEMGQMMELG
jgi:hypothetical protein